MQPLCGEPWSLDKNGVYCWLANGARLWGASLARPLTRYLEKVIQMNSLKNQTKSEAIIPLKLQHCVCVWLWTFIAQSYVILILRKSCGPARLYRRSDRLPCQEARRIWDSPPRENQVFIAMFSYLLKKQTYLYFESKLKTEEYSLKLQIQTYRQYIQSSQDMTLDSGWCVPI